ncbi:beta-1,3-glucosyltransferase [candidate division GN15 bacterium]|uniref:Beta-1,3-glucosyltransferase n=1 Tax=candidate division GN15 bacterium TaxID=2072418 RepID=A0A855X1J3_9BACT|nr:MAG: beta-1,3-glucosyltransferase [candidate division GN15 bacterium]
MQRRIAASLVMAAVILAGATFAQPYKDSTLPVDTRVRDLLSRMTPEEKFWQLFMLAGGLDDGPDKYTHGAFGFQMGSSDDERGTATLVNRIQRHFVEQTRLGIPIIPFAEALHGLVQKGATSYPQAIALAATFDTSLMHEVAATIAEECRRRGIRQVLSPVVNIAGDVRWGRVEETYGEDPFLASAVGVAFVSALERRGVITTPKHFIANIGDGGRDSYPVDMNERLLREIYLPPFEACVRRGGSRSVMTSYNSYDGSPCSANDRLINQLLKNELGFSGYVISDAGAVGGANVLHFTSHNYAESGELAIRGGLDVIFQTSYDHYTLYIQPFLDGRIPTNIIDSAVGRVLRAKLELGLFEQPYVDTVIAESSTRSAQDRELARRAAQESIVLLKNEHRTLPLGPNLKSIAVIGADAAEARLGGYSGPGIKPTSILDGVRKRAGAQMQVQYAIGCNRLDTAYVIVPSSFLTCRYYDTVRNGLRGDYFDNITLSGTPAFTRVDPQIQFQWTLFSPDPQKLPYDFYSVRWTGKLTAPASGLFKIGIDGNDGYRLYLDDSLVIDNWKKASRRTVLTEHLFEKDKAYDIRIEYREPTGNAWFRLVWNYGVPSDAGADMKVAEMTARACDVAVVVAGIEEGEFRDRASLALPGRQEELINRIAATGKPTVVVLVGGSAITMSRWLDNVGSVVVAWYPGEAGGEALADVLFGEYNPAGRLPITFPIAEGQLPLVYNHKPTGRGDDYLDLTGQPLFPFGYGLSYTQFEYGNLVFDKPEIAAGDSTAVHFTVKNVGKVAGDEVVQLYIRDEIASVVRPVTELKGFLRLRLQPGEIRDTSFMIGPEALSMLNKELEYVEEPGDFRITIGASSKDIRLRGILKVVE